MISKEIKLKPTHTETRFDRTIIDYLCDEQPQFRHVYSYFFSPIKEGVEWRNNLYNYLEFITAITCKFAVSKEFPFAYESIVRDGKIVQEEYQKLLDAFHDIAQMDYDMLRQPSY